MHFDALKSSRVLSLDALAGHVRELKASHKTIVHCHGVFDLLHIGHIRYLKQARSLGDVLVVTITPDRYVDKGPHRPAFTEILRAEAVASLGVVDYVAINEWPTAEETLKLLRPTYYVKGAEYKSIDTDPTGKIGLEADVARELGVEIKFIDDIVFSSTNLINRFLSSLPDEIQDYLSILKQRYTLDQIVQVLDQMASLEVAIVGDTILDEYQYCTAIGKSSKDPVLAVKYQSKDLFVGGVLAVANHIANFTRKVHLFTPLGELDSHEEFIREKLAPNVEPYFSFQAGAPTLIKRRILDAYSTTKLMEIYVMDDSGLDKARDEAFQAAILDTLPQCDLTVAADFGHGAISPATVKVLSQNASYLTAMAQANAGNRGFNTITKYPRLDYFCLAAHELQLEMRKCKGSLRSMLKKAAARTKTSRAVVTCGRQGSIAWSKDEGFNEAPSMTSRVIDRIGAGDAFFSISSLCAVLNIPNDLLGLLGNIAGGIAVETIGNQKAVDPMIVKKHLTSYFK